MKPENVQNPVDIAVSLPLSEVETIASAVDEDTIRALRARSAGSFRDACSAVLRLATESPPGEISAALRAAAAGGSRRGRGIEIVWTGPDVPGSMSRLTSSVVTSLVDEAQDDILLISYAVHNEWALAAALRRATGRGVFIQLLSERPADNPSFNGPSVPFPSLPARRLCWPAKNRPAGASMHAKVLVIDRRVALIGSANVTTAASLRNIEAGVLIRDPRAAEQITQSIESLCSRGVLETV